MWRSFRHGAYSRSVQFPVVFDLFGLRVPAHTVFETLSYAAGVRTFVALRRRAGDVVDGGIRWTLVAAAAVGAAAGARVLFWLDDPAATWAHRTDPQWLFAGRTIVGALLGGWGAVELWKRISGVRRRTGDLFAAPLCVGIAVGRIGCFLTGLADHTCGVGTSAPWGIDFGDGVPRHPTQLYESVLFLALAPVFARAALRPHAEGAVFRAFLASYLLWRLVVDFLKPGPSLAGLSGIQWACAAGAAAVAFTWDRGEDGADG